LLINFNKLLPVRVTRYFVWIEYRSTDKRYARDNRLITPENPIDGVVWHLDVVSLHPEAEGGFKGSAVRRLMQYVRWV